MKYDITFSIYARELKAAALFASRDEARYLMNGVLVEIWSKDRILLIGTDGKTLAFVKSCFGGDVDGIPELATGECIRVIIPLKMIAEVRSSGSRSLTIGLSCDGVSVPQISIKEEFSDVTKTAKAVYGMFKNVRAPVPMPRESKGAPIFFDPRLMDKFTKAVEMLTIKGSGVIVSKSGPKEDDPIIVSTQAGGQLYGIIMPLRMTEEDRKLKACPPRPAWL